MATKTSLCCVLGIFVLILLHPLLALAKMADCGTFFGCLGEESYYPVNCEARN